MQPRMLLHMAQLLESPVTIGALVRLLACVHSDMLHQLVVGAERLEALLALVRLHFPAEAALELAGVHLHCVLVHEDLERAES